MATERSRIEFCLRRPLPARLLGSPIRHGGGRWWAWPYVRLLGREWYFPEMLVVWRKRDRTIVRFWPWFNLRRWLFTRCESCGGRFAYGDAPTAQLRDMHAPNTKSIMVGETGCYHWDCAARPEPRAEWGATDNWDRQWGHDDGLRRHVLGEPVDVALELSMLARERREADQRYRRRLLETRREMGFEDFAWKVGDRAPQPAPSKETTDV